MKTIKKKEGEAFEALKKEFCYANIMQAPRVKSVSVSVGTGSFKDKKKIDIVLDRLAKITGQKPSPRGAKKSIASFKSREGDVVGALVTLRGPQMFGFLDKLVQVALPRTKDFRGIPPSAIDEMGNITIGVREHTVFPETADEELKDVFGMGITIVTTAKNRAEARAFLTHLGFPFSKHEKGRK
ncbi:MAG: 50S ribosomal protein L5 [Candidatus Taylorbacteria bacterium RIFCSPHIGHO2_02_FULL_47_18]|uniref:Large ribosomal subunit protein uL5 n=1 Tax=Candidatus Taylorbacteria bacterium RIFCSPLOWO2_01_FULL_48_100 TaxID=1802322 RepID=A0A1G2NGD9_9BACT|nr:MAG: 50S ribosomal protein L5 [Candidatus Taylorbacteria bacterium RIFCSPHIGHO2_01_FULL_48_38]OHA27705.1 MAG: 50S ribosomal protein L5 [Candidatus Taylorbacteria bacterium RIFCSPHIGHO2_02_FULL_47_18]OHA35126.1 MAG: 50S ribosomal protein L5 [Candidatus Taylorbacteria bacterium RIFCSPLOWO2_01_FULL_48_100]OHA41037.1 MAG: 50S ribosomal protein L5 [Candidatus Taylorbacteria bacterium RIFCSPLOWO2_02_FULL_48_16]OHA44792.1 MAG: 50S ribosomal protein L5 [Candidatus Taylorbacteria bacterium RIFCSPLOWO